MCDGRKRKIFLSDIFFRSKLFPVRSILIKRVKPR